jgi:uncharacterized protein YjdB
MKKLLLFTAAVALLLVTGCKNEPPVIAVQSVTVAPDEIALIEGAQQQLAATVLPEDATSKDIVWSSSAPDVATVDESGKVTAVAAGLAIIKATCGGKEGTCAVTVSTPIPVETVSVAPETLTLKPGEGADLTATVLPADATDQTIVWTSSDEAVATVSETGHVTAVATGSAIITATCGGQAGTCDVNVTIINAVDLGLPSGTLWADRNIGADGPTAFGDFFSWGELAPKTTYEWSSYQWGTEDAITKYNYDDARTALLPEDDAATVLIGSDWRLPSYYEWYELMESCEWTWDDANKGYTVAGPNGNSIFFPASGVRPVNETEMPVGDYGGYWTDRANSQEVSSALIVYFYDDGTLDYWSDPRCWGYPVRAVKAPYIHPTAIAIEDNAGTVKVGKTLQLSAYPTPEEALEWGVTWTSSNTAVATVDATGLVKGVMEGTVTITATAVDGGFTATQSVEVTPGVVLPAGVFYAEDFEEGLPSDWILIDADGDGKNWTSLVGNNPNNILGHDDSVGFLTSASYDASALTPDNYAFTPAIKLAAGENKVSAWLNAQDASWPAETFGIGVSLVNPATLTASTVAANTTMLNQWTMTAAPGRPGNVSPRVQGTWYQYTVDLSAYENKTVYIFFRHFDCTDMFRLNLDDVQVYSPSLLLQSLTPVLVKNAPHKRSVGSNQVFKSKKNHR